MTSLPWGAPPSSSQASTSSSSAAISTPATSNFSSSFAQFNLSQPRHTQPSNLTMQLESHPIDQSLLQRRMGGQGGFSSSSNSMFTNSNGLSFSTTSRRQSTLGLDSAMIDDDDEGQDQGQNSSGHHLHRPSSGVDVSMSAFDPPLPSSAFTMSSRSARSRSASESMPNHHTSMSLPPPPSLFANVPPSPVTVARALQAGQKTPPAVFQRRLFKDDHMLDDGSNSEARSSRSGSSSDVGSFSAKDKGKKKATLGDMLQDDDDEIEELSMGLSRSTSGEDVDPRVVRRPVSRKPNLLPKPKSHLRVLSDLRSESAPADLSEIASEATLHRLSRSGASTVPPVRPQSVPSSTTTPFDHNHRTPAHPSTASLPLGNNLSSMRPTPNRFPEQADEDDSLLASNLSESSSSDDQEGGMDDLAGIENGSDWGGMSTNGYETGPEDEEGKKMQMMWNGIRGTGRGSHAATLGKSPGSGGSRGMEVENPFNSNIPQTPSTSFSTRPGKRKITEDRFEPYSHALKRRAVSPAASSLSLSPGFAATGTNSAIPIAPLTPATLPVSIPSPTLSATAPSSTHHQNFFTSIHQPFATSAMMATHSGSRSVAGSPIAPSSLSSSAGRGGGFAFPGFSLGGLSDRYRTPSAAGSQAAGDEERIKMDDVIGRMSLGDGETGRRTVEGREEEEEL